MATIDLNDLLKAIDKIKQEKKSENKDDSIKEAFSPLSDSGKGFSLLENRKENFKALSLETEFLEEEADATELKTPILAFEDEEKSSAAYQPQAKVIKLHPEMEVEDDSHFLSASPLEDKKNLTQKKLDPKWLDDLIKSADHLSRKAKALRAAPLLLTEVYEPSLTDELKKEIQRKLSFWSSIADISEVMDYIKEITAEEEEAQKYYATV